MPIKEELKNIKKLESVGFHHEQAEALTGIIEEAQLSGHESLKEFIHNELKDVRNDFNAKFEKMNNDLNAKFEKMNNDFNAKFEKMNNDSNTKFEKMNNDSNLKFAKILNVTDNIDTHIKAGQYDLLIKIFAIVTGTAGILFALQKLFG